MTNQQPDDVLLQDIPQACTCARHHLYEQGVQQSLKDVAQAYMGTYDDLNEFIDNGITDPLTALFFNAYTVNDSIPGYISFQVDIESLPSLGQFIYIKAESGQIHVFKVTA